MVSHETPGKFTRIMPSVWFRHLIIYIYTGFKIALYSFRRTRGIIASKRTAHATQLQYLWTQRKKKGCRDQNCFKWIMYSVQLARKEIFFFNSDHGLMSSSMDITTHVFHMDKQVCDMRLDLNMSSKCNISFS